MSVYSDVESNNVFFDVTPNKTKDRILESQPVSFYFLLNNSFVSAFGDKSYYRVPFHFKDSTHLDFSVFAGRFLPAPSKMSIESIPNENKSIQPTQDLTLYKYSFNTHLDSTTFVSNNFSSEFREFEIQFFFSFKNSLRIKDSISLKIDFYLPTLDIIDIRLYRIFLTKIISKYYLTNQEKIFMNLYLQLSECQHEILDIPLGLKLVIEIQIIWF